MFAPYTENFVKRYISNIEPAKIQHENLTDFCTFYLFYLFIRQGDTIMIFQRTFILILIFVFIFVNFVYTKDFYELLGVSQDATKSEIRKAFKKLALEKHPDKNKVSFNEFVCNVLTLMS